MTASLFHRRRSERLAQLLEEAPRRHTPATHDEELAGYVRLGEGLVRSAGTLGAGPSEDFRSSLRAMLVATVERDGVGAADDAPETGKRARRTRPVVGSKRARGAVLVGLAVGTLALSGMSAASGDAMPGDPLYGVKRSTESARLALAGSDVSRGQLYLEFARNRLAEAGSVGAHGNNLGGMLADMDNETRAGVRLLTMAAAGRKEATALDVIDTFVREQRTALASLTDQARTGSSLVLLDRVALRSAGLRGTLACGPAGAPTDDLGAQVPTCHPAVPRSGTHASAPATRHESTTTGGTGHSAPGSPSPSPLPSGLLDDVGRLLGGH